MTDTDKRAQLDKARADIDAGNCLVAIPSLLPLAESGNIEAQYLLGYMYFADCEYALKSDSRRLHQLSNDTFRLEVGTARRCDVVETSHIRNYAFVASNETEICSLE